MNQPASKEPTMDEILSSIRQIIADDDDGKVPEIKSAAGGKPQVAEVVQPEIDPFENDDEDGVAPLALSPEQIIGDQGTTGDESEPEPDAEMPSVESLEAASLVVPDDVAFEQDRDEPPAEAVEESTVSLAQAAPMPDGDLSADLAEELLEPATKAAVRSALSRLNSPRLSPEMTVGAGGLTIEGMIRDMMRPMLKDWLEENLPSMVERIVAQEIERVSRGGN